MENLLTPTKIVKTNRRTLSLIINNKGELIVRSPLNYKDSVIFDFINKKANWIIQKRTEILENIIRPLKLISGEQISLLGQTYIIQLDKLKSVKVKDNNLIIPIENSKTRLVSYLKRTLKKIIEEKIYKINQVYDFKFKNISISSAKTNWGSCSGNNNLHFTYKLMLCPEQIIDYLVVHELVHTIIKNHSKAYWRNVKMIYPYYKECERWLKKNRTITEII